MWRKKVEAKVRNGRYMKNCEAVKAPATPLRAQQRWSSKADTCLRKPPDTTRVEKNATRHVAAT